MLPPTAAAGLLTVHHSFDNEEKVAHYDNYCILGKNWPSLATKCAAQAVFLSISQKKRHVRCFN